MSVATKNPVFAIFEVADYSFAATLRQIAVNGKSRLIFGRQFFSQPVGGIFGFDKDEDGAFTGLQLLHQFAVFFGVVGFDDLPDGCWRQPEWWSRWQSVADG